jgi:8-oxo-dGTP pyrophosphatase MutT (NUDIX family)
MTKMTATERSFNQHIAQLRQRLHGALPGTFAQLTMAPLYRQDPSMAMIDGKPCREAGVLALFFPVQGITTLLLTVRRADLKHHAGQVSFPGGRREPNETLREAALRETHEEVGLSPDQIEVLGTLTPLYIPPSNFCVHPFVGMTPRTPVLRLQDDEVETLLYAPLPHLLAPETRQREPRRLHGRDVEIPFLDVQGYKIWGATAMMLAELLALFAAD